MRLLPALFMMAIFSLCMVVVYNTMATSDPADEARNFLRLLQRDDYARLVTEFGDNTCHCAPKGGYESYLRYDKAWDPNLAFLRGQTFQIGEAKTKILPFNGEHYVLPWNRPEDRSVIVQLTFPDAAKRPYFLPMDMAFGYPMNQADVVSFARQPQDNWLRAFCLRLRPSLKPGLVGKPSPEQLADEAKEMETMKDVAPELLKYMHPTDAAPVKLASGETVPAEKVANELPRVKSVRVGFRIVRNGIFHRWAVKRIGVVDPVLSYDGKDIPLTYK